MAQEDWIIIIPAIAGYLIWPFYRLIVGSKKSKTNSLLMTVFLSDVSLSLFLSLDMMYLQSAHVTDAGDTILVILFVALFSFVISVLTIAVSGIAGLIKNIRTPKELKVTK